MGNHSGNPDAPGGFEEGPQYSPASGLNDPQHIEQVSIEKSGYAVQGDFHTLLPEQLCSIRHFSQTLIKKPIRTNQPLTIH